MFSLANAFYKKGFFTSKHKPIGMLYFIFAFASVLFGTLIFIMIGLKSSAPENHFFTQYTCSNVAFFLQNTIIFTLKWVLSQTLKFSILLKKLGIFSTLLIIVKFIFSILLIIKGICFFYNLYLTFFTFTVATKFDFRWLPNYCLSFYYLIFSFSITFKFYEENKPEAYLIFALMAVIAFILNFFYCLPAVIQQTIDLKKNAVNTFNQSLLDIKYVIWYEMEQTFYFLIILLIFIIQTMFCYYFSYIFEFGNVNFAPFETLPLSEQEKTLQHDAITFKILKIDRGSFLKTYFRVNEELKTNTITNPAHIKRLDDDLNRAYWSCTAQNPQLRVFQDLFFVDSLHLTGSQANYLSVSNASLINKREHLTLFEMLNVGGLYTESIWSVVQHCDLNCLKPDQPDELNSQSFFKSMRLYNRVVAHYWSFYNKNILNQIEPSNKTNRILLKTIATDASLSGDLRNEASQKLCTFYKEKYWSQKKINELLQQKTFDLQTKQDSKSCFCSWGREKFTINNFVNVINPTRYVGQQIWKFFKKKN